MTASNAFKSIEQAQTGKTVYVTTDLATLKSQWEEAELGAIDEATLKGYLGCPGKIIEVEDDDDTVKLEWVTKDCQWIPICACLSDLEESKRRHAPAQDSLFKGFEPFQKIAQAEEFAGKTVYVTDDLALLKELWAECELGACDDGTLSTYLGCPGKVLEIEDDDDTVKLEWVTKDCQWIPFCACLPDLEESKRRHAPAQDSLFKGFEPFQKIAQAEEFAGKTVYVTDDLALLKELWEECELGALDDGTLGTYLGCPGKVLEIEDDDDTVKLEWITKDTQWIPFCACLPDLEESKRRHAPGQDALFKQGETVTKEAGEIKDDHELIESECKVVEV